MRVQVTMRDFGPRSLQVLVLITAIGALAFAMHVANGAGREKAKREPASVPVIVSQATVQDLEVWKSGVGSVQPLEVVDVKARVDGQISKIDFAEGHEVHAGEILAKIDPRPYQALLSQAVAAKEHDAAQLANSKSNLLRSNSLASRGFVTAQAVDSLKAEVTALSATLAGDQAQIDRARLNLEFTNIRSPIAGRTGIRQANTGATVHNGDPSGIVTVTQMQPIGVVFSLPQDDLAEIHQAGPSATVFAYGRDDTVRLAQGALSAVDSQVDPTNGRVRLKAVFDNPGRQLWPGELITVRLLSHVEHGATVVPSAAIQMGQNGPYIYVLAPNSTVLARSVTTGAVVEGKTAIVRGIHPGETVVISGQSRISDGTKVEPRRQGDLR